MNGDINLGMLQKAAEFASKKHGRPDLADDAVQEMWFDIDNLKEKFDPEKGTIESLLYRHADYKISGLIRGAKEQYVENIYEIQSSIEDEGGEIEASEPENDIIGNIDKDAALDRIRQKLLRNGRSTHLQVVQTYKDKIEGRRSRKRTKGKHDTPERKKLVRLEESSGVSRSRFAKALGMTPQRYQSLIDGTVKQIPREVIELAENVVIDELPQPYTNEQMIAWCEELLDMVPLENATLRRKEEFIANIVSCSRTTVARWRNAKTKLLPQKAQSITVRVKQYIDSVA